jgi:cyanophycinase
MKKLLQLLLFLSFALTGQGSYAQSSNGHLVIIGGGDFPDYVMKKIIDLAGGKYAKIIVIPNASSEPEESAVYIVEEFKNLGCTNVNYILFTKSDANKDSLIDKLSGATGIFFGGGDQAFLTRDLLGTKLLDAIKNIYENGGVISGTSAGAAVMSHVMITGNELKNNDSTDIFITIEKGNVENIEGFGFLNTVIIDQHFIKRKRLNRLISLVLENPDLIGVGIDEETSIIVNPANTFDVLGENQVMIFNPSNALNIKEDSRGNLGVENLKVDILLSGDKYDLKTRSIIK